MSQVDQVTQRNASAAEELASTAEEMASQAEALQQLVSYFRVTGLEGVQGRMTPAPSRLALHPAPGKGNGDARTGDGHPGALAVSASAHHDRDFKRF